MSDDDLDRRLAAVQLGLRAAIAETADRQIDAAHRDLQASVAEAGLAAVDGSWSLHASPWGWAGVRLTADIAVSLAESILARAQ